MHPNKKRRVENQNIAKSLSPSTNTCKKESKEPHRDCDHIWEEDDIDFISGWTEKSMSITYCIVCYKTKK
jgi:hypothetical protein